MITKEVFSYPWGRLVSYPCGRVVVHRSLTKGALKMHEDKGEGRPQTAGRVKEVTAQGERLGASLDALELTIQDLHNELAPILSAGEARESPDGKAPEAHLCDHALFIRHSTAIVQEFNDKLRILISRIEI